MMYRGYYVDSGLIALSATGLTPLLYVAPPATSDANIIALMCSIEVGASNPTAVANSDLFFSLNTVTGTKAGGAAVTPQATGPSALAANTVFSSGSTALTGLTQGAERWGHPVPFSAGAFTDQAWENTGREINLAASGQSCFYVNVPAGPGVGANFFARVEAWIAE